jgi:xanthine dehydrogenase molybdenum-binding subunit
VSAQDTGQIINALGHQGQIDGAVITGMGYALSEELVLDEGRIANANLGDYKLMTVQDVPELVTVNLDSKGPGPYDAKAIGETPSVPVAGAIANAVADAIGAPILDLPITAERVLAAIESARAG